MRRVATLVALADMVEMSLSEGFVESVDKMEASSVTDGEELFLPKLNFHLEGFFAIEDDGVGGVGGGGFGFGRGLGGRDLGA